jgi:hypothetical protein
MFGDELTRLVHRGVDRLDQDIELLEALLSATKAARTGFNDAVPLEGGRSVGLPIPTRSGLVGGAAPAGGQLDSESYDRFESALRAAGMTPEHDMLDMLRVLANANRGFVQTRTAAQLLIRMGLSESSMVNLPGYLGRKMLSSGEFRRVGKAGSGLYRWRLFKDLDTDDGVSAGSVGDEGYGLLEPSDDEVSGGRSSSEVEEHSVV